MKYYTKFTLYVGTAAGFAATILNGFILLPIKTRCPGTEYTVADLTGGQPCTDGHGMPRPTPAWFSQVYSVSLERQSVTNTRGATPRTTSGVISFWRMRPRPLRRLSTPGQKPAERRSRPGCRRAWERSPVSENTATRAGDHAAAVASGPAAR